MLESTARRAEQADDPREEFETAEELFEDLEN